MQGIPTFSKDIVVSLVSSMNNDYKTNTFSESIGDFWQRIHDENPNLFEVIMQSANVYRNQQNMTAANAIFEGAHLVLSLISRQAEVDEMNEMMA